MVFSSIVFMFIYLPITLFIYYLSPRKYRNLVLCLFSLLFYGWGEPVYIGIMIFSIVFDYFNGYMVNKYRDNKKVAKRFVILSVAGNLALLGFFKYADFFITNLNYLGLSIKTLGLELPIGISFYTFQTMSYPIDVYRNDAKAEKSLISFGTYVSLFPQLIAGPIVRFKDIADQLNHRQESHDLFYEGVLRFMRGLAKKVLLANSIGLLSDTVFESGNVAMLTAWLGAIAYTFQIYFDFSGYSDMAIGLGKMYGFTFPENFNYPYMATSITDFWRRWHISLSTWFRDYVYIPLGGNRVSKSREIFNLLVVWCLTGFWHGASWNYLIWGFYYAVLLIIEKTFFHQSKHRFITLILVTLGWVIFKCEDLSLCTTMLRSLFDIAHFVDSQSLYLLSNYGFILVLCAICSTDIFNRIHIKHSEIISLVMMIVVFVLCISCLVSSSYNPFLYFRF